MNKPPAEKVRHLTREQLTNWKGRFSEAIVASGLTRQQQRVMEDLVDSLIEANILAGGLVITEAQSDGDVSG